MGIGCFILSVAFAVSAGAARPSAGGTGAKVTYPPQRLSSAGVERIEITGVRGSLHLVGSTVPGFRLKVGHTKSHQRADDWNLLVERRGTTLFLEVASTAYGKEWRRLLRQQNFPEFDISLEGPALPTRVSWQEGSLYFRDWQAPLETSLATGDIRLQGGSARQVLNSGRSRILVRHFNGDLEINGESGQVDLFQVQGALSLNWLRGPLTLTDVNAQTRLETADGLVHIVGGSGDWLLKALAGSVSLNEFGGHIRGQGQSTHWNVRGHSKCEIELVNAAGSVDVDWKSTAKVFLTSISGVITSPYDVQDRDGHRVASGRKGTKPLAQVFVRTETGDITFKY